MCLPCLSSWMAMPAMRPPGWEGCGKQQCTPITHPLKTKQNCFQKRLFPVLYTYVCSSLPFLPTITFFFFFNSPVYRFHRFVFGQIPTPTDAGLSALFGAPVAGSELSLATAANRQAARAAGQSTLSVPLGAALPKPEERKRKAADQGIHRPPKKPKGRSAVVAGDEGSDEEAAAPHERRPAKFDHERNRRTVFVGNLPVAIKPAQIEQHFKRYGRIEAIRLRNLVGPTLVCCLFMVACF